jgi:hypothetical protein
MSLCCTSLFVFVLAIPSALAQTAAPADGPNNPHVISAPSRQPAEPVLESLPPNSANLSQEQIRALIQKVADNDLENDKKQRNYTYIRREEERKLNRQGEVQSTESRTEEVMMLGGSQVDRLIAKNDKPLSAKDNAKEEERIQKIIEKRKNETQEQRKKRLRKEEKDREEARQWVSEISEAFNFRLEGTENIEGRETYIVDAEPRPGFKPHLKYAKYLPKFRFRVWLDKAEMQWVKLDAEVIDNLSWGLFVARLHTGAHILVEQTRVNDEVWLPKHEAVKLEARIALLKNFRLDEDTTYRDYKKFRTNSKIVSMGEVQQEQQN